MPDVPATLPTALIAGNTWVWDREFADFPPSTWTATAYFEKTGRTFNVPAAVNGTSHRFTVDATTTATYQPGRYLVRVRVTDGTQVFIAESVYVEVEVDPAASGTTDTRTWARRTLDAIEAFLEGNASTAQASMSIGGRSIARWSLSELREWRAELRTEVKSEELGTKAAKGRDIKVRFV